MFSPSKYQLAIFDFVKNGRGDGIVDAVPGSGKTTTLIEAAKYISTDRAIFVAFNKHIADEISRKLYAVGSTMKAQTLHSLGYQAIRNALGNPKVEAWKYDDLAKSWLVQRGMYPTDRRAKVTGLQMETLQLLVKLVKFSQLTLADYKNQTALMDMAGRYLDPEELKDETIWQNAWQGVAPVLQMGIEKADRVISFEDQLWLPNVLDYVKPQQYDWIFADECQDFNAAQRGLVLKARGKGGRILFVGDKHQSIYGFTGADTRSMDAIQKATDAKVLPLSICYRCPTSHIDLAAKIFPGIEPAIDAGKGEILHIKDDLITKIVGEGDLIICRTNTPLITTCFALIRSGIAARIRGRDIGKGLVSTVKQIEKIYINLWEDFQFCVNDWRAAQLDKLSSDDRDGSKAMGISDKAETVIAIYEGNTTDKITCLADFESVVNSIFSDCRPSVWLSSVHRAKGLEAETVYILQPGLMPHPMAKKSWEIEQENNIKYVAFTRAKRVMVMVTKAA